MNSEKLSLSAADIRRCALAHRKEWRKFQCFVERATEARYATLSFPPTRRAYLVFRSEEAGFDLLMNLKSGEIHEMLDSSFKEFLMNHDRTDPDERPLFKFAEDELLRELAAYTDTLNPRAIKKLFATHAELPFVSHIDHDDKKPVRHYHYDIFVRRGALHIVIGVAVICKKPKL